MDLTDADQKELFDNGHRVKYYLDKDNRSAQKCYRSLGMDECHYLMYEEEHAPRGIGTSGELYTLMESNPLFV